MYLFNVRENEEMKKSVRGHDEEDEGEQPCYHVKPLDRDVQVPPVDHVCRQIIHFAVPMSEMQTLM